MSGSSISTLDYLTARQPGSLRPRHGPERDLPDEQPALRKTGFRPGLRVKVKAENGAERSAVALLSEAGCADSIIAV